MGCHISYHHHSICDVIGYQHIPNTSILPHLYMVPMTLKMSWILTTVKTSNCTPSPHLQWTFKMFHTESVCMLMIYFRTECNMPSSNSNWLSPPNRRLNTDHKITGTHARSLSHHKCAQPCWYYWQEIRKYKDGVAFTKFYENPPLG